MVVNGVENTMCLPHDVFFIEVKTNSSQQKMNGQPLIIFKFQQLEVEEFHCHVRFQQVYGS